MKYWYCLLILFDILFFQQLTMRRNAQFFGIFDTFFYSRCSVNVRRRHEKHQSEVLSASSNVKLLNNLKQTYQQRTAENQIRKITLKKRKPKLRTNKTTQIVKRNIR